MSEGPSLGEVLAELPLAADQAVSAVLELYGAIRQANALGASYGQLAGITGMPRPTVQVVCEGRLPKFAVDR